MYRVLFTTVLAAGLAGGLLQAQTINQRRENQQKRIDRGARSGQLTDKEVARLEAEEARLTQMLKEDKRDGKGLTVRERAKAQKRLDKISRDIAKQKHDRQTK